MNGYKAALSRMITTAQNATPSGGVVLIGVLLMLIAVF